MAQLLATAALDPLSVRIRELVEKYNNLDYELKSRRSVASINIINLTKNVNFENKIIFLRLPQIVIKMSLSSSDFQSVCNHIDVSKAILDCIFYYQTYIFNSDDFTFEKTKEQTLMLMLTLLNFCATQEVSSFLETCLIKNSPVDNHVYVEYKKLLSHKTIEMILLEEADLYAVISYLKISDNSQNLSKIWIPHSMKFDFLSLKNRHFRNLNSDICIFESKQELLTPPIFYRINVTSIWTENIAAAKNLAASLDRNIVLINTLDFYDGIIFMPYTEIFKILLPQHLNLSEDEQIINMIQPIKTKKATKPSAPEDPTKLVVLQNLFYDGAWQQPVKNIYWTYNSIQRANATRDDVSRCVASARKGFKIWSALSTESRMQVLSKFASALEHNGKPKLSKTVFKWLQFPYWYRSVKSPMLDCLVTRTCKPKGIITLMAAKVTDLFQKLTQSLVIGNSVIVICTMKSCNIAEYCDMLSTSGIPPGVVNLLSCHTVKLLNAERYKATELREMYHQFTISKQVVTMI
ncbi:uncharacterized protein LOC105832859 [Monomorium pharaonis]|uniref:uncharacterized protein LOC105832859 n=1 Tax=Monomorium pharaonis TaxID=307658 RepID=UPI00063F5EE3|nr:uncharacterized protein LOC105832859 [Monomorium pharaonis]